MVSIQGVDRDLPRKAPHPASLCIHPRHAEADAGQGEFYTLIYLDLEHAGMYEIIEICRKHVSLSLSIYIYASRSCIYIIYKPDDLNTNDSKKRSLHYKTQVAVYYPRGDILRCMSRMIVTQCPQKWAFCSFVHWLVMPFPKAHWFGNLLASYRGYMWLHYIPCEVHGKGES